jgi:hypothetical protein
MMTGFTLVWKKNRARKLKVNPSGKGAEYNWVRGSSMASGTLDACIGHSMVIVQLISGLLSTIFTLCTGPGKVGSRLHSEQRLVPGFRRGDEWQHAILLAIALSEAIPTHLIKLTGVEA